MNNTLAVLGFEIVIDDSVPSGTAIFAPPKAKIVEQVVSIDGKWQKIGEYLEPDPNYFGVIKTATTEGDTE
jgi:hypothetical protein